MTTEALRQRYGYLDPALAPALALLPENLYGTDGHDVDEQRRAFALAPEPELGPEFAGMVRDLEAEESTGRPALRIITPTTRSGTRPVIFWIHGGGYVVGTAFRNEPRLFRWAVEQDAVVISVEYPLAPEHPYPAGLEACYAGLTWVAEHAAALGVDLARIAVAGESAGGGLAAALALLAHERCGPAIRFQLLIYPMLDDRTVLRPRRRDTPVWTTAANRAGWAAYLGGAQPGVATVPVTAAPARALAAHLVDLPPSFISVGSLDLFRDENIAYASALQDADVPTELRLYAGSFHGSDHLVPDAAISRRFERDIDDALSRALAPGHVLDCLP